MRKRWLVVLILAVTMAAPAVAQGPGDKGKPQTETGKAKEKEKGKEKEKEKETKQEQDRDSDQAKRELKSYYEKGGPKPKDLPPGIAKNLERGKPLPPGIEKTRVPDGLAAKLPKRAGEEWAMVGNRLVSVDKAGVVKEVITP